MNISGKFSDECIQLFRRNSLDKIVVMPYLPCMVNFFSFCKSRDHKEFFSEVFSSIHLAFKAELSRHNVGYASLTVHGHL